MVCQVGKVTLVTTLCLAWLLPCSAPNVRGNLQSPASGGAPAAPLPLQRHLPPVMEDASAAASTSMPPLSPGRGHLAQASTLSPRGTHLAACRPLASPDGDAHAALSPRGQHLALSPRGTHIAPPVHDAATAAAVPSALGTAAAAAAGTLSAFPTPAAAAPFADAPPPDVGAPAAAALPPPVPFQGAPPQVHAPQPVLTRAPVDMGPW